MNKVCVITGGGSGMGLATARLMGKDHALILVGRNSSKLEKALTELKSIGIAAEPFACDIADRSSVDRLAALAQQTGLVSALIHAAGMSPHMGDPETILSTNALGTINLHEAFSEVIEPGGCILDVSSMVSYLVPGLIYPRGSYKYSSIDKEVFVKKMMARINLFPTQYRQYLAYAISKNFVIWYAKTEAARFGQRGVRVLSVSPGFFDTPMGDLEKDLSAGYTQFCALKRTGHVEEIASLLAFCASDQAGYLTGVDILCDGGCVASGVNPIQQVLHSNQSLRHLEIKNA
jgi:NAD(P)-dependent dehydrogenase (short-subunit alcohol dehydrogenase family)